MKLTPDTPDSEPQTSQSQPSWGTKLFNLLIAPDHNPTLIAHISAATAICASVVFTDGYLAHLAAQKKYDWMTLYYPPEISVVEPGQPLDIDLVLSQSETRIDALLQEFEAPSKLKNRLRSQFLRIQSRAAIHGDVMAFFYGRSFVTLVIVSVSGIVGVVCLFFISKDGWSDCNNMLLNLFVLSAGIVVLYGNLSIFLKFDENTQANTELYLAYLALKEEFLSYLVTNQVKSGETVEPEDFIHYVDLQMEFLNTITLQFDHEKLTDYTQQFERVLEGEQESFADPAPGAE